MPTRVDIGNGYIAEFPDGMSKDDIATALRTKGPGAAAAQPQAAPAQQNAPLGQSPFRGGVRGELTLSGRAKPSTPADTAAMNKGIDDFGRGAAIGVPSGVIGMPGDIEGLGRFVTSPLGVSRDPFLPTSHEIGDAIAGPAQSRQEEGGRGIGGMLGPPAALKAARTGGEIVGQIAKGGALRPGAAEVRSSGYALPPNLAQEKPSLVSRALSAWGGKTKMEQSASIKNQQVTNAIAAKELGVTPGTQLTKDTFDAVRKEASKAYGAVSAAMPQTSVDLTFASGIRQIGRRATDAAKEFPELAENGEIEKIVSAFANKQTFSTKAAIDQVRQLRHDAASHLKSFDDPAKASLGQAERQAANLIEELIERRLAQVGNHTLMNDYRNARQLIAKSHDVEAATNLQTGEVSALDLARMADKGRPLTGGLAAIAKMGGAFPQASREAARYGGGEAHSVMDAAAAALAAGAGRLDLAGIALARPVARGLVLSNPYQKSVLGGAGNASVPGASAIAPQLLYGAQNAQRLLENRKEPR